MRLALVVLAVATLSLSCFSPRDPSDSPGTFGSASSNSGDGATSVAPGSGDTTISSSGSTAGGCPSGRWDETSWDDSCWN